MVDSALAESGGALVSGPVGVGKTHLIRAAAARQEKVHLISVSGAQSDSSVPLAPLLIIGDLIGERDVAVAVLAELARRSRKRPVLLVVDDCHLLDEASAALIHRAASSDLVSLLLANRSEEMPPAAVTALWKDSVVRRVDLAPLGREDSNALAATLLKGCPPAVADWLWEQARGHPLFIRELCLAWADNRVSGARGHRDPTPKLPVMPDRLREVIGAHLGRLEHRERLGMAVVALAQPLDDQLCERMLGRSVRRRLARRGLIRETRGGVQVTHPLYAEAAVDRLPPNEADKLRFELADALSGQDGNDVEVATLLLDAGTTPPHGVLQRATDEALRMRQPALSLKLASALADSSDRPSSLARLAAAHAMNGAWDVADPLLERAVRRADPAEAAPIWLIWVQAAFEYRRDPGQARALAQRAMQVLNGADRGVIRSMWLRSRMFVEPLEPVYEALAGQHADPDLHPLARGLVCVDLPTVCWPLCRPHAGLAATPSRLPVQLAPVELARLRQVRVSLLAWATGLEAALAAAEDLEATAQESGDPDFLLSAGISNLMARAVLGQAAPAAVWWDELQRRARATPDLRWLPTTAGEALLAITQLRSRQDECRLLIRRVEALPDGDTYAARPLLAIARSRLLQQAGDHDGALAAVDSGVAAARERQARAYEVLCLRERLHLTSEPEAADVDRVVEIANAAGPGLATIIADEARAVLRGDPDALLAVCRAAESFGALACARDAAVLAGHTFDALGRAKQAFECALAVDRLLQDEPEEFLLDSCPPPVLTPSQREVADLAATGATNTVIAAGLYVSPRTVKRHLEDVYRRLGIAGRHDLAELYA